MTTTTKQQQPKKTDGKAEEQVPEVSQDTLDPLDEFQNQAEMAYTAYLEAQRKVATAYKERERQEEKTYKEIEQQAYESCEEKH